ncbi:MAG TPA: DUF5362 family protein [Bacteroidia bacterium]|jgi:hypothetical protein|nr:DUF5362 family protein [Bacteroidia bacterium]
MENTIDDFSIRPDNSKSLSTRGTALLTSAAPWVKWAAIIGFVSGLMSLGKAIYALQNPVVLRTVSPLPGIQYLNLITPLLSMLTAYFLFQYAQKLSAFSKESTNGNLKEAFAKQKTYFIWSGIMTILLIVLVIVMMVVMATIASSLTNRIR